DAGAPGAGPAVGGGEGEDGDLFRGDVEPDVALGPVRQRKPPNRLAGARAHVVDPPQLGPLLLRIPAVLGGADREHPLLGSGFLLVTPGSPERTIEAVVVERLLQPLRLPHVGVQRRPVLEGVDAQLQADWVLPHQQLHPGGNGHLVAELVHRAELPGRVDVQQREWRSRRVERLARQVQQDAAVLAHRVEHHRPLRLGNRLPHDVDALRLETLQVAQRRPPRCRACRHRASSLMTPCTGPASRARHRGRWGTQGFGWWYRNNERSKRDGWRPAARATATGAAESHSYGPPVWAYTSASPDTTAATFAPAEPIG